MAIGKAWHKMCVKCKQCNKSLDSTNLTDKDNEIYCKGCYAKLFGPSGFGFGALHHTKTGKAAVNAPPPQPSRAPAAVESKAVPSRAPTYAPPAAAAAASAAPAAGSVSRNPFKARDTGSRPRFGGGEKCGVCSKSVYAAERVAGAGQVFHKTCFKCTTCKRSLDSTNLSDRNGVLYCSPCYGKDFGPKGFGNIATSHTQ
jgi:cysteine and glycine-rich protein